MIAKQKCLKCRATCWATVTEDDPTTNSFVTGDLVSDWEGGASDCDHDDFDIVETEDKDCEDWQ